MVIDNKIPDGYKLTEVGVIPEDWDVRKLGQIATKIASGTSKSKSENGVYLVYGSTGIIGLNDSYDYEGIKILVARVGANAGMVNIVEGKYCVSDNTLMVSYDNNVDSLFSYYQLVNFGLNKLVFGSGQPLITGSQLKELSVHLPPLPEQTAIATALSDVDNLITSLNKLIDKKRNIKQGTMQELLTGKKRLQGFNGKWKTVRFSEIADNSIPWSIVGGPFGSNLKVSDYTNDGVRILQLQNIGDGCFHNDYAIYTSETKANELISNNIYPGEIILSKMGDPVARACFVPTGDRRYLMASDGIRLAVDSRRFNSRFVHDYINSVYFRKKAIEASTGSTRQRIGLSELKQLPFVAPPLPEQQSIAQILNDMDIEINQLEQKRDKYALLKQGMMQQLLTGKIRLI